MSIRGVLRVFSVSRAALVVLCAATLAACSGAGRGDRPSESGAPEPGSLARLARPPAAPPLEAAPEAPARRDAPGRGDFEFSGGRRAEREPRPERGATPTPERDRRGGPGILVVWEALAREKALLESSRHRRRGPLSPQKITLVNASHPDARLVTSGRGPADHGHTAVLQDADMEAFLAGIRRSGFYRYARPLGAGSALIEGENARGRITVTRNGTSRTLLSLRGQGRDPRTRDIPRIYSEAKQAIMVLKNMSPTLNVSHVGAAPLRSR